MLIVAECTRPTGPRSPRASSQAWSISPSAACARARRTPYRASEFLDLLYDDLEQHVEATKAAMEIAAGQMLSTGVVSLPGVAL
ncbi:MAG: hypothetical protein JWN15_4286, partial [Firmicutes bacterium]|nr:hypothetical protein [Bacillota bacterium]